jgi:4-amino-4-deoxy-L-arabinose transferase-like glycosyltransferase
MLESVGRSRLRLGRRLFSARGVGLGTFAFALSVRLLIVLLSPLPDVSKYDQSEYLALAQNIRLHGTLSFGALHRWGEDGVLNGAGPITPTAARGPTYPAMIASLWWGESPPVLAVYLVQALLGAAVAWLVYSMALSAFGPRVAIIAGVGMALAPTSSYFVLSIMTETLFTFLLTCSLWFWGRRQGFAAGLLMGSAILTRPILLYVMLAIGLAGLIFTFNRKVHLWLAIGAILVVAPWTLRNAVTQHEFVPVATYGSGAALFFGSIDVPYGSGSPYEVWFSKEFKDIVATSATETEAERRLGGAGIERITGSPVHWLWIRLKQYPRLFMQYGTHFMPFIPLPPAVVKVMFAAASMAFFLLSIVGTYLAREKWQRAYHLALVPLALFVLHFPAHADARYSLPTVPMLMVFTALAISRFWAPLLGKIRSQMG